MGGHNLEHAAISYSYTLSVQLHHDRRNPLVPSCLGQHHGQANVAVFRQRELFWPSSVFTRSVR